MIKLSLIAEERTKPKTIDHLVEGLLRVIPIPLEITEVDERYSLKEEKVWRYGRNNRGLNWNNCDAVWLGEAGLFYNLFSVRKKFKLKRGEYLLMLTHSPFIFGKGSIGFFVGWDADRKTFEYGGTYNEDVRTAVVGGANVPSNVNVKIASHEIGHALLDTSQGQYVEENGVSRQASHCKNYVEGKRCVMNTKLELSSQTFNYTYLGFCDPCAETIRRSFGN